MAEPHASVVGALHPSAPPRVTVVRRDWCRSNDAAGKPSVTFTFDICIGDPDLGGGTVQQASSKVHGRSPG